MPRPCGVFIGSHVIATVNTIDNNRPVSALRYNETCIIHSEEKPLKKIIALLVGASFLFGALMPVFAQDITKLRVLGAPGVTKADPKDWHNSLAIQGKTLTVNCPKCSPINTVTLSADDIGALRYGGNAYHHWVAGIVSGVFSLGIGLIVGLMPHHQHYFSIDTKEGKVVGLQADKSDYRQLAGALENFTGLPIIVASKDAHYLAGYNTKIEDTTPEKK